MSTNKGTSEEEEEYLSKDLPLNKGCRLTIISTFIYFCGSNQFHTHVLYLISFSNSKRKSLVIIINNKQTNNLFRSLLFCVCVCVSFFIIIIKILINKFLQQQRTIEDIFLVFILRGRNMF